MSNRMGRRLVVGLMCLSLLVLATEFTAQSSPPDRGADRVRAGREFFVSSARELVPLARLVDRRLAAGHLKPLMTQTEDLNAFRHERLDQYHKGVKVWGAQLIRHSRAGEVYLINGNYHDDIDCDVTPGIDKSRAALFAAAALSHTDYELSGTPELLVFPDARDFRLVYLVNLVRPASEMAVFVDAKTGEIVFKYDDCKTEDTAQIGLGRGTFGDWKKLSTTLKDDGKYYSIDMMRPARLITGNNLHGQSTSTTYYCVDDDNSWDGDPSIADGMAHLGWTYDYFYLVHDRAGMDDNNMQNVLVVHFGSDYQNAFFMSSTRWLYFGDGLASTQYPYVAALDIVAHEFAHGVNYFSCNQTYWGDSGACNEAFSDIMGVSCEFFHQSAGNGYGRAEWWEGEDTRKPFGPMRDLSDPYSQIWYPSMGLRYPDHWARRFTPAFLGGFDNDGVHINMTIGTHWYYLLANGGTNRYSGNTVSGIGVGDAEKIAYRAWVFYANPNSGFQSMRSATYQAAIDLFGGSSHQRERVEQAWNAVGVY